MYTLTVLGLDAADLFIITHFDVPVNFRFQIHSFSYVKADVVHTYMALGDYILLKFSPIFSYEP